MPENNTGDPQAGDPAQINPQGQEPTTPPAEPQAGEPKPSKSAEDLERMIAELRKENASHRTKLKKFEDEEAKRTEAQMTEQQKLEKRYADKQREHEEYRLSVQERITSTEIRAAAADLGFADLSDAIRLLDRSELEFEEDGTPTNAKQLLEKLAKAKPYLLKGNAPARQPSSGGATNPPRSQTSGQAEITDAFIASLTPAAYSELSPDMKLRISQFMQSRMGARRR